MASDEFVDLYEVLELPVDADVEKLRKRINELYLEAQRNLDHRNVQKRLRFQQLFELYLPQARHLLLDPERRAEYDQYLQAYHSRPAGGSTSAAIQAPSTTKEEPASLQAELTAPAPRQTVSTQKKVRRREEEEDPAKLAAEREQLWSKWKGSLEQAFKEEGAISPPSPAAGTTASTSQTSSNQSAYVAPAEVATAPVARTQPEAPAHPQPMARPQPAVPTQTTNPPVAQTHSTTHSTPARPMTTVNPSAGRAAPAAYVEPEPDPEYSPFAQIHEQERLSLIRSGIETAGVVRGFTVGIAIFLVGCLAIFGLDSYLSHAKNYPLGLTRSMFAIYLLCAITTISLWCGWVASRAARRQASSELSYLSREELLRRNKR